MRQVLTLYVVLFHLQACQIFTGCIFGYTIAASACGPSISCTSTGAICANSRYSSAAGVGIVGGAACSHQMNDRTASAH
jgi:hypothetical protein